MSELDMLSNPIFFESDRVWRCYLGGKLLDEFLGNETKADANFPEDWLASVTRADNGEQQQSPDEGLSRVKGSELFFSDILQSYSLEALGPHYSDGLGILCKFLDSAIRLPIQCHPDGKFAQRYFHSAYGKTESWLILATREINGEKPYVLLGFKPDVTPERFRQVVMAQDIPSMTGCLHKFPVEPGDGFFIPGRVPHAIGPGVLLLEVQEPTDFVIQPERKIGGITLSEAQMWAGLDHETAFTCFDYHGQSANELLSRLKLHVKTKIKYPNAVLDSVVALDHTDCFQIDRLTFCGNFHLEYDAPWYLVIITLGQGMVVGTTEQSFHRGDRFFVSNKIGKLRYRADGTSPVELFLISRRPADYKA